MKIQIIFIGLIFLYSCNSNSSSENPLKTGNDNLEITVIEKEQKDTIEVNIAPEEELLPEPLTNLLENPLDLAAYKKKFGPANSGGYGNKNLFDTPDEPGFMYRYMLFHKLGSVLKNRPTERELFEKFRLVVFKKGTEIGQFTDENESLMALECGLDNSTLGDLNVYGMTKLSLIEKFGEPQHRFNENFIYASDNKVISIHFNLPVNSKLESVDWFKYARLNKSIDLEDEVPSFLLSF